MKKLNIKLLTLALCMAFGAGAMAQNMPKAEFKTKMEKIEADYKAEKTACASSSGNAKDICIADAKGKEKIAKGELESSYKPSAKTHYKASVAKAEAEYAMAKERCGEKTGNAKDVCIQEAKAAEVSAKADAKVAREKSDTSATAKSKVAGAKSDAAAEKSDANYKVAQEKCDALAGATKDKCLADAKMHFGK